LPARAFNAALNQFFGIPFLLFWLAGGLMLFGMALYRTGILRGTWKRGRLLTLGLVVLVSGLGLSALGLIFLLGTNGDPGPILLHCLWFVVATPLLAVAYAILLAAWCESGKPGFPRRIFAAAGRMAFSNYIGQSVLFGLIFYGHGLGLKGELSFAQTLAIVPGVWAFQLTFSVFWLRHFRQGPLEWFWRSLIECRPLPIRRAPTPG